MSEVIFVEASLPLTLPFHAAASALDDALADGGLVSESRRALADGLEFVMPVGPRGSHFPSRQVSVRLLRARRIQERLVVPLRWETIGPTGRLFPALDADLELAAGAQPNMSRLSIIGSYRPPLAALGRTIDSAVMSKVASATMAAMLREVATKLETGTA